MHTVKFEKRRFEKTTGGAIYWTGGRCRKKTCLHGCEAEHRVIRTQDLRPRLKYLHSANRLVLSPKRLQWH